MVFIIGMANDLAYIKRNIGTDYILEIWIVLYQKTSRMIFIY